MLRRLFRLLPLRPRTKKHLKFIYFRSMAALGIDEFPALNAIDRKMLAYLPQHGGVFVEAGANDGISQSNTWYLEAYRGWSGLLIEPVPELAALARRFRRAPVANVALGPADGATITLRLADLTTAAETGPPRNGSDRRITVPVRALSSLLDEHAIAAVDFFSLDVEGYEIPVLQGLDLARHRPKFILVETADFPGVRDLLAPKYEFVGVLSEHDYLFAWRH